MRLLMCLVVGLVAFLPVRGEATALQGQHLYAMCGKKNSDLNAEMFCTAYVVGFVEGASYGSYLTFQSAGIASGDNAQANMLVRNSLKYCIPGDVSTTQIVDVFAGYLVRNRHKLKDSARFLLWLSLVEAFPCSDQQKSGG